MGMFDDLERQAKAWDKVSVDVDPSDSVDAVARKLKAEGKRHGALELSASELRGLAQDAISEARKG